MASSAGLPDKRPEGEPATFHPKADEAIIISYAQQGNPLTDGLRDVPRIWAHILPDYLVSRQHAVVFISCGYHRMHPKEYLRCRLAETRKHYRLCICLCLMDIVDAEKWLLDISRLCFRFDCTLFLAWSNLEAAKILETFKIYEKKSATDFLLPRLSHLTPQERGVEILITIPTISKVDALGLIKHFGSLRKVLLASQQELIECPGIGDKKARAVRQIVDGPFFLE